MNEAVVRVAGHRERKLAVVCAVSAALVLAQAVVFAASGLMLFAMAQSFHWSATAMGTAYTLIVLGACAGAPMPIVLIRRIGGSGTIVVGMALLAVSFLAMAFVGSLPQLYACVFAIGVAFSLSGNSPGVYLVSGWGGAGAGGLIGIYLMIGMLGNAVGPPLAQALIGQDGWQGYALTIAAFAVVAAIGCALALREPPVATDAPAGKSWRDLGAVLRSRTFALLAVAIVMSQLCLVTVSSVAPAHLAGEGVSDALAARLLGVEGIAAALATGLLGHFAARLSPRRMLPLTLAACGAGLVILAATRDTALLHGFAMLLGAGVGGATLTVTLLLVRYFGPGDGAASLGAIWTLAGLAALGPWGAGLVADATGSYAPGLLALGLVMVPIAAGSLLLPKEPRT
ncbi:major facilitator transporter [Novosphingobium sp. Rr 2-17]|uniref:MFS transporter n=1 Tax=Novosphingobium sp. Rr 2-17 TaxID=555793 RepID=UPI00026994C7|nr:MFS transporter [Novosphingobium sp. Rr 2-17]EIZ81023.1 major facilitator transporter [Novosphingobium sp. Rr 2-17]